MERTEALLLVLEKCGWHQSSLNDLGANST